MSFDILGHDAFDIPELDDSAPISKRSEARQRVLLRAQLHAVNRQAEVHISDISRSGLRGSTDIALYVDQMVFISLDDMFGNGPLDTGSSFRCEVWPAFGSAPTGAQTDIGKAPDHQARMPRITTHLKAKISLCNGSCGAKIRNVSKSGMMVETDVLLTPND